jgi:hypothetical protein
MTLGSHTPPHVAASNRIATRVETVLSRHDDRIRALLSDVVSSGSIFATQPILNNVELDFVVSGFFACRFDQELKCGKCGNVATAKRVVALSCSIPHGDGLMLPHDKKSAHYESVLALSPPGINMNRPWLIDSTRLGAWRQPVVASNRGPAKGCNGIKQQKTDI